MATEMRATFLAAVLMARDVVAAAPVGERWSSPSALPLWTVGGLAGHLARAAVTPAEYMREPAPAEPALPGASAYFAAFVRQAGAADLASPANAAIRARGDAAAAAGHAATVAVLDSTHRWLEENLPLEPVDRVLRVGGGQAIRLDDYLATRLVEITLHVDDVCVSVGLDTPTLPGADVAINALVGVARILHGDTAVLRGLARRERDPGNVLRVL